MRAVLVAFLCVLPLIALHGSATVYEVTNSNYATFLYNKTYSVVVLNYITGCSICDRAKTYLTTASNTNTNSTIKFAQINVKNNTQAAVAGNTGSFYAPSFIVWKRGVRMSNTLATNVSSYDATSILAYAKANC